MVGRAGLLDARHFLSSGRGYPLTVSSVIKYKPGVEEDRRLRYVVKPGRSPLVTEMTRVMPSRALEYCLSATVGPNLHLLLLTGFFVRLM